jgi:polyisoprenyl-phosphate glycosyltransferase
MKYSLDIVIPCFNESRNVIPLIEEIKRCLLSAFKRVTVIFVDDGSIDDTEAVIQPIVKDDKDIFVKYIKFTRNYGKEIAVKCGIDHSESDLCVIMDGDLQHPPASAIEAFKKMMEDKSSIVYITPLKRIKYTYQKLGTYGYQKLLDTFSREKVHLTDFTLIDKKAANIIKLYNESDFYTRGILSLLGLKASEIFYTPQERKYGETKFSLKRLIGLAVYGVISVSTKPLRIAIYTGTVVSLVSMLFGTYLVIEKVVSGQPIPGFATLGFGMFFFSGIQLMFLGLIGEYVGKTFIQSKNRPIYTIDMFLDNTKVDKNE